MSPSARSLVVTPFKVAGAINSPQFQKAKAIAEGCAASASATVTGLMPVEYDKLLLALQTEYGGPAYLHEARVAVYSEVAGFIGDDTDLIRWLERNGVDGGRAAASTNGRGKDWESIADAALQKHMVDSGLTFAYLEMGIDGQSIGRLVFELFPDLAPKTVANFLALCDLGDKGYAGTPIHRVKAGGWMQGGDVLSGDGDGGRTASGESLPDEVPASSSHTHAHASLPRLRTHNTPCLDGEKMTRHVLPIAELSLDALGVWPSWHGQHRPAYRHLAILRHLRPVPDVQPQVLRLRQAGRRHEAPSLPGGGAHVE